MYIEHVGDRTLKDCHVLIVDDQSSTRLVLETLLEDTVQCISVGSGSEAVSYCEDNSPDLILMDVSMPDLDGHATTAILRKQPSSASIPIMFVTSSSTDEDESRCWESGCIDFIVKPVNACTLRNRVKSHLMHKLRNDLLERLIYVDKLTGAYNRHYLDDYLPDLVREGLRNVTPLCLIMFDVDHFKLFNDMYGHLEGDSCLWKVSRTISDALLRPMDKLIRIGGEEFLVVLPNTDLDGAIKVTKRLLELVCNADIPYASSEHNRVTLIAGIALKTATDNKSIEAVMLEADKNLYHSKEAGRNCVTPSTSRRQKNIADINAIVKQAQ